MINVKDKGAVGDFTTDDTAAFQAAAADAIGQYDGIYIPSGSYRLTEPLRLIGTGVIRGDGPNISWLIWDGGNGIEYTATEHQEDFCKISDLTLRTRESGGTAIRIDFSAHTDPLLGRKFLGQYSSFSIKDVFVQPHDINGIDNGWGTGLETLAAIYGVVRDCNFYGRRLFQDLYSESAPNTIGLYFHGINDDHMPNGFPYVFILDNVNVSMTDQAVIFKCLEGGFMNDCNLVCVNTGVVWQGSWEPPWSQETPQAQLNIANCHINATTGILVDKISSMSVMSTLLFNYRTNIQNEASRGIVLSNAENVIISNNQFRGLLNVMDAITATDTYSYIISNNLYKRVRHKTSGITVAHE